MFMDKQIFRKIIDYVLQENDGFIHDAYHSFRVANMACYIARKREDVNMDILIASCLLHDIARSREMENSSVCHAKAGGEIAYSFLKECGWDEEKCSRVRDCIVSHRYSSTISPESIEAKILFDADKLDMTGAIGIARVLLYQGFLGKSIYAKDRNSFLSEYQERLLKVYDSFYTDEARELANNRENITYSFYQEIIKDNSLNNYENVMLYIS